MLTSMNLNTAPVTDASNPSSNAVSTDLNSQEQDGLDDDFTRFLNSQETTSRTLPWQEPSGGMGTSGPAEPTSADDACASFLHPFDDTISVARSQRFLGAPTSVAGTSTQAPVQTGGRTVVAHQHRSSSRVGAHAPIDLTLADGPFQDEVFGPIPSNEHQYLMPTTPPNGSNLLGDPAKAYGSHLYNGARLPRSISRGHNNSQHILSGKRTPSVSSYNSVRRAPSSGGEVAMIGSQAFSQQLQQLLHETAQVYEAGQIMGYLEPDDSFDKSIAWMKRRVASTLTGQLHSN